MSPEGSRRSATSALLGLASRVGPPPVLRVTACARPCGRAGGDFYDIIPFDAEHLGVFIGDVSGHGPQVAALARKTRELMSLQARRFGISDPASMLRSLNRDLCAELPGRIFVTAVFGILHRPSGALRFVRAGHSPPLLFGREGPRWLGPGGIALGIDPGAVFGDSLETQRVVLRADERLLFHTDGLTEAWHPDRGAFGRERLVDSLTRHAVSGSEEACLAGILLDWRDHLDGVEPADDVTLVLVHHAIPPRAGAPSRPSARSTDPQRGL